MTHRRPRRLGGHRPLRAAITSALLGLALLPGGAHATPAGSACRTGGAPLVPRSGVWFGASLDWAHDSVPAYSRRLGATPAVDVSFVQLPLAAGDARNLDAAVRQVRRAGGMLLLTLEPQQGLAAVTDAVARGLAARVARYQAAGVPVLVRFAHEMNGSWYPWAQQPAAYVAAFRRVAAAVHHGAPGAAMLWAPNYGGGYPFAGGAHQAPAGSADARALDTDGDGAVTGRDDPYAPYYPGDDAVDWVGMTLYHFGNVHPWGENEVPEPGKFAALLTGTYVGLNGDESAVPDFDGVYATGHRKPLAIPETGALYAPGHGGATALQIKQAWWNQVFAPSVRTRFPRLAMVNWFEWDKTETEIGGRVDWTATRDPAVRSAFRAALPSWLRFGADARRCGRPR